MSTDTKTSTRVFRLWIKAPQERVWEAITSSEWSDKYGYKAPFEYDLRPGGAYRAFPNAAMKEFGSPDVIIDGEVIECDPPNKLVHTWHAMFEEHVASEPPSTLTWELSSVADGVTMLTLVHDATGAPYTLEMVSGDHPDAGGGWTMILSDLKTLLETGSTLTP